MTMMGFQWWDGNDGVVVNWMIMTRWHQKESNDGGDGNDVVGC